jgi:hypothetical protein
LTISLHLDSRYRLGGRAGHLRVPEILITPFPEILITSRPETLAG